MFTGIIQIVGSVARLTPRKGGARLAILAKFPAPPLALGESVAVDGACLTVAARTRGGFEADLSGETLSRTTAGAWLAGRRVNLERAIRAGDSLGGHFVQGHVDG